MSSRRLRALAMAAGAGYLLGSIPSADIATRLGRDGRIDLRTEGSHNPGALNAIEVLGKRRGYAVGVADIAKGAVATVIGRGIAGDLGAHVGGTAAVVGHCYPVWSGFRGGKGVASAVGQLLVTFPAAVPIEVAAGALGAAGRFRQRSYVMTALLAAAWVGSGLVWWRQRRSNAWGTDPTLALPVAAAVSSAVVLHRFADERRGQSTER
jgi:glycerol-3-phosphate acyltransferase PlsY